MFLKLILNLSLLFAISTTQVIAESYKWINYHDLVKGYCFNDNDDYLLISTENAFIKLDKATKEFNFFDNSNSVLKSHSYYHKSIIKDSIGNLYFASDSMIYKFDGNLWSEFLAPKFMNSKELINSICFDSMNNLWIAFDSKILVYSDTTFKQYYNEGGCKIIGAHRGNLYFFYEDWVNIVENEDIYKSKFLGYYTEDVGFMQNYQFDSSGTLWICYRYGKVQQLNNNISNTFESKNSILPDTEFNLLTIDSKNNVFVGTNKGLFRYNGVDWKSYNHENTNLESDEIKSVFVDSDDSLWIIAGADLCLFNENVTWEKRLTNSPFPISSLIKTVFLDKSNCYWIGTDDYLIKYKSNIYEKYDISNSNLEFGMTGEIQEVQGKVFVSCYSSLYYFQDEEFHKYDIDTNIVTGYIITHYFEDKEKNLWICYRNGVALQDNKGQWYYWKNTDYELSHVTNIDLSISSDGNAYLLTEYGAIYIFNPLLKNVTKFCDPFYKGNCFDLLIDRNNTFWIINAGKIYKNENQTNKFVEYYNAKCLVDKIFQTGNGHVWIGTNLKGIARIDTASTDITWLSSHNSGISGVALHGFFNPTEDELWCNSLSSLYILSHKDSLLTSVADFSDRKNSRNFLNIYPNPSNGIFTIENVNEQIQSLKIVITDILGRIIVESYIDNTSSLEQTSYQINLENFINAVYTCTIISKQSTQSKMLVLVK